MEPQAATASTQNQEKRERSGTAFTSYGLSDSIAVAKVLYDKGGGQASREHLAAFLEYKSTDNGAFKSRIGSAKLFGFIESVGIDYKVTPLGQKILMPESQEQLKASLVEAFFSVPLFKAIYEEYKGRDLPEGLGLKNALRIKFKVVPGRIEVAYRALFDSAETAGFFETRGSKTQLIIPVMRSASTRSPAPDGNTESSDGKSGGGGEPPTSPPNVTKSRDDLQNDYIATLIEVLRDKSKQGDMDHDLMERIEKLLNLKSA